MASVKTMEKDYGSRAERRRGAYIWPSAAFWENAQ